MPQLTLPIKPHANQLPLIRPKARFNVIAAGRRFGKTEAEKLGDIYRVMQGKHVWWVNPTFDNTTDAWQDFLAFFSQFVPRSGINKSRREIVAPTGGKLRMLGADNFKRGSGIDHVSIDEAAFINLSDLWDYQLRPMLLESKGSATFLSSTNGRNAFWKLYQLGLDPNEAQWQSWHFTSYDNPLLDPAEIEDIKRNTPERVFQQEYMAEFLDDGGAVFRNLKACIYDTMPQASGRYVFGVDLARHNDYTVITCLDTQTHAIVDIDRFNETAWSIQELRLKAMAQKWQPTVIVIEENFNDKFAEDMHTIGLPVQFFRTTSASKQQIINQLALAFEQADIHIPNDETLLGELQAYTLERLPSGNYRYNAPSGLHDDMVMSLALAWYGMTNHGKVEYINIPDIYGSF